MGSNRITVHPKMFVMCFIVGEKIIGMGMKYVMYCDHKTIYTMQSASRIALQFTIQSRWSREEKEKKNKKRKHKNERKINKFLIKFNEV